MKRQTKRFLIAAFCLTLVSCSIRLYKAEPISGVVIDESTGLPIAHAVVSATWFSQSPSYHSPNRELFETQEAVADEQGRFTIPGWRLKLLLRWWASIDGREPALMAYKYGYQPIQIWNWGEVRHGFVIEWNRQEKISLKKLEGTALEIETTFDRSFIPQVKSGCDRKKGINMILEMDKQMQDFEEAEKNQHHSSPDLNTSTSLPRWLEGRVECSDVIKLIDTQRETRKREHP